MNVIGRTLIWLICIRSIRSSKWQDEFKYQHIYPSCDAGCHGRAIT